MIPPCFSHSLSKGAWEKNTLQLNVLLFLEMLLHFMTMCHVAVTVQAPQWLELLCLQAQLFKASWWTQKSLKFKANFFALLVFQMQ